MTSTYRCYTIKMRSDGAKWRVTVFCKNLLVFPELKPERFNTHHEAFDRACEVIDATHRAML
jgi:hypothetical protein